MAMNQRTRSSYSISARLHRFRGVTILWVLAVLIVVLILAAFVTIRQQLSMINNRQEVMSSYELSGQLEKPLSLLKEAENAAQAYLLTGDRTTLAPINTAVKELDPTFDEMVRHFRNNNEALEQIATLKKYYDGEFAQLRQIVARRGNDPSFSNDDAAIKEQINKIEANSHALPLATYKQQRQFRIAASSKLLADTEQSTWELLALVGIALLAVTGTSIYAIVQLKAKDKAIDMVRQVALETVATQEKLSAVLASMDEGLCLLDGKGRISYLNRAGENLLGYKSEEILDTAMHDVVHASLPDGTACCDTGCPLAAFMVSGISSRAGDDSFLRKDGRFIDVHYIASPLVTNGTVTGAVLAFFDIAQRKVDELYLKVQYQATLILAEGADLNQSVEKIIRLICSYFDWQVGALWVVERDSLTCLQITAAVEDSCGNFKAFVQTHNYKKGKGLPGLVWAEPEPLWMADIARESILPECEAAKNDNLHGAFALPVMAGNDFVGVLAFFDTTIRERDETRLSMFASLCAQLGQFIQRLRAAELLAISDARYALAIDGSMDGVWDWNVETGETFLSLRFRELLGLAPDDGVLAYEQVMTLLHPDDREQVQKALDQHIKGLVPIYQATFRMRTKSGEYRWFSGRGRAEMSELSDRPLRMAGSVRDITQDKEAAEKLRLSEQKFKAIFDSTFEFIGLLSPDGILLEANKAALNFIAETSDQIVGKPFWEGSTWPEKDRPRLKQAIETAASGKFDRFEVEHIGPSGIITIDFSLTPVFDQSGKVVLLVPEGRDISQVKVAEARLGESEALFRQLAENIREIFWVATPDSSRFFYVSPAFEEITGRSRDTIESNPRSFWDALDRKDRRRAYYDFKGFAQGKEPREGEYKVVRPNGEVRWIATKVFPIFNEKGEMVRSCGVARDINDKKEAERRVSEFYSTVSHELRSPLTSIRGSLGLIEGGVVGEASEQVLSFVTIARSESDRLIRLVNNILDLRKIEGGNLEPKFATVNVSELIDSALDALQGMAVSDQIELIGPEKNDYVMSLDKDLINQVLINLISNAIKFSDPGKQVKVTVSDENNGFLRFAVIDHGPGIPAGQAHKLFGKFQQLDSSDTRSKGGTGLGLAISKAIVEQHAGIIGFDSVEGEGATFWFRLPLPKNEDINKHRALIFSTDGVLSEKLRHLGEMDRVITMAVGSVEEASRRLRKNPFDVLILDVGNNQAPALELMNKLAELKKCIPVIAISDGLIEDGIYGKAFILRTADSPLSAQSLDETIVELVTRCQAQSPLVLFVEDDPATRAVVKQQIGELGINCLESYDGEHALALIRKRTPDLIVLDVGLPRLTGFELIAALRKEAKNVPVIVYTARDLNRDDREALSLGLTRYLTKSQNSVQDLLTAVRELLSGISANKS